MPTSKIKSVRALAEKLGISHTTASDALRNNPRVNKKTRERVQRAARELGYDYNPLVGSVMSEIRKSTIGSFRGIVSIVDLESDRERHKGAPAYHRLVFEGAKDAASRLGYKVDHFILGEDHTPISRLNNIFKSRGIRGILFLPVSAKPEISGFDWDSFSGIYTDYLIDSPAIHTVCPNHFRSMTIALQKLRELGYKRPGLVLLESHDRRLLFRWEAAFSAFCNHHMTTRPISPLIVNDLSRREFANWFEQMKPDVVMCHKPQIFYWMKEMGLKVPETHGYCCLNVVSAQITASGLDLMPRLCGERAMETLIAQLQRNENGIPEYPSTHTYDAIWVDGGSLRTQ